MKHFTSKMRRAWIFVAICLVPAILAQINAIGAHATGVTSINDSALITDETALFTGAENDFLNIFNNETGKLMLILIAILGLGFGVMLLRRFTRPKGVR